MTNKVVSNLALVRCLRLCALTAAASLVLLAASPDQAAAWTRYVSLAAADEWGAGQKISAKPRSIGDLISKSVGIPLRNPRKVFASNAKRQKSKKAAVVASTSPLSVKSTASSISRVSARSGSLARAVKAISKGKWKEAIAIRNGTKNGTDLNILNWLLARSGAGLTSGDITSIMRSMKHWPNQGLMRIRSEQALARENPGASTVLKVFSKTKPRSNAGKLLLARAYLRTGKRGDAARIIRNLWRYGSPSRKDEREILSRFRALLTRADHHHRVHRLLYDNRNAEAKRLAKHLSADQRKLVDARIAVNKKHRRALRKLKALPKSVWSDPGYTFSLIQQYRRSKKYKKAAGLMLGAPRNQAKLIDPDEWWIERRLVSRHMLDLRQYSKAYKIASQHSAKGRVRRAEAEFHAGWYALRFLKKPSAARQHFQKILSISSRPLSQSRGLYWLGRTYESLRQINKAKEAYSKAARYGGTFYGQLAAHKLSRKSIGIAKLPRPNAVDIAKFNRNELVKAIKRLHAINQNRYSLALYLHLARTTKDARQLVLLARLAERQKRHRHALIVGKLAALRFPSLLALAYPTAAIPKKARISARVEMPMVYAIARQESAFNPKAISRAGARGLLQLMPGTAKITARKVKLPYSKSRLTTDPAYNTTLGSAFLDSMLSRSGGSYIMTFAAYNAGPGRVDRWVANYGDPRSRRVDAVDWIERISITETRNYVQRISENLQVYRHLLAGKRLNIAKDLQRGRPSR